MNQNVRVFKKRLQIAQKKWNTVQAHSIRTVNIILNIISRLNLVQNPNIFSEELLTNFEDIPERLSYHLAELINSSLINLNNFISQFSDIIKEMRKIEQQFRVDFSLLARKQVMEESIVSFHDIEIIEQAENTIQTIVDMYETELTLKKQLIAEIQSSPSFKPLMITAYLVLWSSEIYIESERIIELIEEFTFVEKIALDQISKKSSNSF